MVLMLCLNVYSDKMQQTALNSTLVITSVRCSIHTVLGNGCKSYHHQKIALASKYKIGTDFCLQLLLLIYPAILSNVRPIYPPGLGNEHLD